MSRMYYRARANNSGEYKFGLLTVSPISCEIVTIALYRLIEKSAIQIFLDIKVLLQNGLSFLINLLYNYNIFISTLTILNFEDKIKRISNENFLNLLLYLLHSFQDDNFKLLFVK
jgi:hypothetical protein